MERPGQSAPVLADRGPLREPARPAPLLIPAGALIGGIWLAEAMGPAPAIARGMEAVVPVVVLLLLLWVATRRRKSVPILVGLVAVLALAVGFARQQSALFRGPAHIARALAAEPELTRIVGCVVTAPVERPGVRRNLFLPFEPPPRTQFVLAAEEFCTAAGCVPTTGQVRVSVEAVDLGLALGTRVQLTGKLYGPVGPRNPGETDWAKFYRYQGIDAGMSVEGAAHVAALPDPPGAWYRLVAAVRGVTRNLLYEPYADVDADAEVRLLDTMVLGQRRAADEKLNEAFLRAGALHLLAVSGFNVNVLALTAWWLVRRVLRRGRTAAAVTALVAIGLFAVVTEPNAPVLRATVVGVIATLGSLLQRRLCLVNALAAAAIFVLLVNPLELFRAGFQLSFVQVLAFVAILPVLWESIWKRRADGRPRYEVQTGPQVVARTALRWLLAPLLTCLVAWIVSLPLQLVHFGYITPWGWLGSLVLGLPVTVATVLSLLTLTANALIPPVGLLLGELLRWSVDLVFWLVGLFPKLPWTLVPWQPAPEWLALGTFLGMLWMVWTWRRTGAERTVAKAAKSDERVAWGAAARFFGRLGKSVALPICLLAIVWAVWLRWTATNYSSDYALHVLAVGNGGAMVLTTPEGSAAVFDVGTDTNSDAGEVVAQALLAWGVRRVALVSVSHANFDHFSGLPTLMARVPIAWWATNASFAEQAEPDGTLARLRRELPRGSEPPEVWRAGETRVIGAASIEVLWPPDEAAYRLKDNDTSLVQRVTVAGRRILLTGDIEKVALQELVRRHATGKLDLRADVLVAPHHGSVLPKVTADFYATVSPSVVLVSTRTARPKLEGLVAERLGASCRLLMTRDVGAVSIYFDSKRDMRIETPLAPSRPERGEPPVDGSEVQAVAGEFRP